MASSTMSAIEIPSNNKAKMASFNMIPDEILTNIFAYANEPKVATVNKICHNVWMNFTEKSAFILNDLDFEYFLKWHEEKKPLITRIVFRPRFNTDISGRLPDTIKVIYFDREQYIHTYYCEFSDTVYETFNWRTSSYSHSFTNLPPQLEVLDIRWCYQFRKTFKKLPTSLQYLCPPHFTLHPYRQGVSFYNKHNNPKKLPPHVLAAIDNYCALRHYDDFDDELRTHISSDTGLGDDIADLGDFDD